MDYLAFDLGAESGRAILGSLDGKGILRLKEVHRFPNTMVNVSGHLHWDACALYGEMLEALRMVAEDSSVHLKSIGVDTWGVDFALLGTAGDLLGMPYAYRDSRTDGVADMFFASFPKRRLYNITGIQTMPFNTLFQLYSMARGHDADLATATDLLFMPDLFNYFLTGIKRTEFTCATTSQLYNPHTMSWDEELFRSAGVPLMLMQEVVQPGSILGQVSPGVTAETGLRDVSCVAVGSHDTASAVAAVPAGDENFAYISSGTWSIMGVETRRPVVNPRSFTYNISNEGGIGGTFRVLKNIMGLWLLQQCRVEWAKTREYSYEELAHMAGRAGPLALLIDPDAPEFFSPESMPSAILEYCVAHGQNAPGTTGAFVRAILESLALAYRYALAQLREASRLNIKRVHIVGGGSRNKLLCQLTADAIGLPVCAGPVEATSTGNILVQAMAFGQVASHQHLREIVRRSFQVDVFEPHPSAAWEDAYRRFLALKAV